MDAFQQGDDFFVFQSVGLFVLGLQGLTFLQKVNAVFLQGPQIFLNQTDFFKKMN